MKTIRICLGQINPIVGDLEGNADKIIGFIKKAKELKADIVAFPELSLSGYPPEDLLLKPHFIAENKAKLLQIAETSKSIFSIIGFPYSDRNKLFNAAALIYNGKLLDVYKKIYLPNYGVFDEKRYFSPGDKCDVVTLDSNVKVGVNICEDIWYPKGPQRIQVSAGGAKAIINISASPYHARKIELREKMLSKRARENNAFMLYCNLVGGQDELVFDGGSLVFDNKGRLLARGKQFEEDLIVADLNLSKDKKTLHFVNKIEKKLGFLDEIYAALKLGIKDYVGKNNFRKVVLGLSGGIDSALVAVLAKDALGSENVVALTMPSQYSSSVTRQDAKKIAGRLGIKLINVPIGGIYKSYLSLLKSYFKGCKPDIAEENIQARIRGNLLMGFSNKFGWLVLTTGNKSEISTGYCTLYGDMAGGFAVLKDVPKGLVYRLAEHRNKLEGKEIIPKSVLLRAPSAELRKNQKDQDTLPPYPVLDKIIDMYVEKDMSLEEIVKKGFNRETADRVVSMIDKNEYKRRQAPPGIKITPKAFGKDRRIPITNAFSK
ncbi:MAG: NAD+ synthase [Candidatus Omnitrophica bacterium]|nr:NAD+ synthase [Candidatus Omnitrophota bacterium]